MDNSTACDYRWILINNHLHFLKTVSLCLNRDK